MARVSEGLGKLTQKLLLATAGGFLGGTGGALQGGSLGAGVGNILGQTPSVGAAGAAGGAAGAGGFLSNIRGAFTPSSFSATNALFTVSPQFRQAQNLAQLTQLRGLQGQNLQQQIAQRGTLAPLVQQQAQANLAQTLAATQTQVKKEADLQQQRDFDNTLVSINSLVAPDAGPEVMTIFEDLFADNGIDFQKDVNGEIKITNKNMERARQLPANVQTDALEKAKDIRTKRLEANQKFLNISMNEGFKKALAADQTITKEQFENTPSLLKKFGGKDLQEAIESKVRIEGNIQKNQELQNFINKENIDAAVKQEAQEALTDVRQTKADLNRAKTITERQEEEAGVLGFGEEVELKLKEAEEDIRTVDIDVDNVLSSEDKRLLKTQIIQEAMRLVPLEVQSKVRQRLIPIAPDIFSQ